VSRLQPEVSESGRLQNLIRRKNLGSSPNSGRTGLGKEKGNALHFYEPLKYQRGVVRRTSWYIWRNAGTNYQRQTDSIEGGITRKWRPWGPKSREGPGRMGSSDLIRIFSNKNLLLRHVFTAKCAGKKEFSREVEEEWT